MSDVLLERLMIGYVLVAVFVFGSVITSKAFACCVCGERLSKYLPRILFFSVFWPAGFFWTWVKGWIDDKKARR